MLLFGVFIVEVGFCKSDLFGLDVLGQQLELSLLVKKFIVLVTVELHLLLRVTVPDPSLLVFDTVQLHSSNSCPQVVLQRDKEGSSLLLRHSDTAESESDAHELEESHAVLSL